MPGADGGAAAVGDEVRTALAGTEGEAATLLTLRSVSLDLPFGPARRVGCDGRTYPLADGEEWGVVHEHDLAHRIEVGGAVDAVEGRVSGRVWVEGAAGAVAVNVRHFWEAYPTAVRVRPDGIAVGLLPPLSDAPPPGDEDAWHRLYFWRHGAAYKLKAGMAPQRDLLLTFPAAGQDAAAVEPIDAWFAQPPRVRPGLAWLNGTGALSPIAPKTGSPVPAYEAYVDAAHRAWAADRERTRAYGFLNFGDWYGESQWSWGNNEYDAPFAHYTEFLRGGEPGWFALAGEATRHLVDVDTCNAATDPDLRGGQYMHMPGHVGGYLPPYFRSKMPGSRLLPSHLWVEGPVLHYLLTGDESVRESLARTAAWLTRGEGSIGLDRYDFATLRDCGWHLTHLTALARMTDDPRYLNAARIVVERVLERQGGDGGWDRLLTLAHCACPPPRHRGEAGFMAGILLSGLRRFHELTADARVAEAIVRGAQWLVASTYDRERRLFRYTTCPEKRSPSPEYTIPVLDGLAYADALRPDPAIGAIVARGLDDLGATWGPLGHLGVGKALCWQTRFVPTVFATWQRASAATDGSRPTAGAATASG